MMATADIVSGALPRVDEGLMSLITGLRTMNDIG
jgi:hypothetical protein